MQGNKHTRNAEGLGRSLVVLSLALLAAGCGSKGEVSGKVMYQGKHLTGGFVTFLPSSGGAFNAKIKEDGSFSLSKVPTGTVKIGVVSAPSKLPPSPMVAKMVQHMKAQKKEFAKEELEKMPPDYRQALEYSSGRGQFTPIPKQYNDAEKSGLEYTVTEGEQEHDIELK